jgi:hypothetical protein
MKANDGKITIAKPNFKTVECLIRGTLPLVMHKFSEKAKKQIQETQEAGAKAKGKKVREPRDFERDYHQSMHISAEGWAGIPAPAFRNSMISACRLVGAVMTRAKLTVFVEQDGIDPEDGTPLVKITKGEPHQHMGYARNETGVVDLRSRAMWDEGWESVVRIKYDGDMMDESDVVNLLSRAGQQVGILEGRFSSKNSNGCNWGAFEVVTE